MASCLMFGVSCFGLVPWGDGVFAANAAVEPHCRKLSAALSPQGLSRRLLSFSLSIVHGGCTPCTISLIYPFAISVEY